MNSDNKNNMNRPGVQPSRFEPLQEEDFLKCADKAYNVAFRLAGNDQDAQDLVQEAFARAWTHRDRFDPSRSFEAWVIRILQNVFLDSVRRYEHKHKVSMDAFISDSEDQSWSALLEGKDRNPVDHLIRDEEEHQLQEALNALPVHYRSAIVMSDIEGLSYEQISEIMKIPTGTVGSRVHQGRVLLKKALEAKNNKGGISHVTG